MRSTGQAELGVLADSSRSLCAIRNVLGGCRGFAFVPIEVDDLAVAHELAERLGNLGHRVRVLASASPSGWPGIVDALLTAPRRRVDATLVAADISLGCDEALASLDARLCANSVGQDMRLLWCGPRSLLCRTVERAPRLWAAALSGTPVTLRPPLTAGGEFGVELDCSEILLGHLRELLAAARQRSELEEAVRLARCATYELVARGRAREGLALSQDFASWLDERACKYPEISARARACRTQMVSFARLVLARDPGLLEKALELQGPLPAPSDESPSTTRRPTQRPTQRSTLGADEPPEPEKSERRTMPRVRSRDWSALPPSGCKTCGGTRRCLTCGGSGRWYQGLLDEEECSSCCGTGLCPDC